MILDDKLMKYVLFQKRTVQEVRNKCKILKYTEEYTDEVIEYLIENDYLDDELYVMKYILNTIKLKKKSSKEIKYDLLKRGIQEDIVDKYMDTPELNDFELKSAVELARKKMKECDDIIKVKKYLLNKGYQIQFVNKAIDILKEIGNNSSRDVFNMY